MNSEYDKEVFEEEVMFDGVCVSLINDKISELSEKYNCDYMVYRSWDNETISDIIRNPSAKESIG